MNLLMDIRGVDFLLGLTVGLGLGFGLAVLLAKVRSWLGRSETGRLAREVYSLKRRLAEKDRSIGRMISETERLAQRLGQGESKEKMEAGGKEA